MKTKLHFFLTLILLIVIIGSTNAATWYVKPNAPTTVGAGTSWDNPVNISVIAGTPAGLADGDIVYMAAGTYESSTSKSVTKYISIIGGYPANSVGTDLPTRNLVADSTIFTPTSGGTARCLVLNATTAPTVAGQKFVLDGLNFKGFTMATANGGTALNITSSQANIEFKNCDFISNVSLNANGGAIYMGNIAYNITVSFDNCNFKGNQANTAPTIANGYGGALFCNNGTTNTKIFNFTNCLFKNNSAYGRGGALYFSTLITCNITDCYFDTNYSSNTTDNYANGNGGCIYVAGGTASNTFNLTRTVIVNSSGTAKGSVFWFNTTPKNTLNLTNCSLIGNYAKRTTSARSAIDADNFTTNIDIILNGCVLSNYNNNASAVKQSNCADFQNLSNTPTVLNAVTSTFSNSILNGEYFSSSNAFAATSPTLLYKTTGYLADSTINLALSGDLKITDKIVFKKTFTASNVGAFVHAQIFDVKKKMSFPMTLQATIPSGYKLTIDAVDYSAGEKTINIAASASDPVITLAVDGTTATKSNEASKFKLTSVNSMLSISGLNTGDVVKVYNANGQLISNQIAKSNSMELAASGFIIVKINSFVSKILVK